MNEQEILKRIKKVGWDTRTNWLSNNPGKKFMSTYKLKDALQKPKDWNAIAEKCSNNPNHEHYGKPASEILTIWRTKGKKGMDRGNKLDDYITERFRGHELDMTESDEATQKKCIHFDNLYVTSLHKFGYVGSEIWMNSDRLNMSCRLDSLLLRPSSSIAKNPLLIAEWKNTENITFSNRWERLLGPASHLDDCDINHMTLQVYIYKYILEDEYGISSDAVPLIFQFKAAEAAKVHKPAFEYDKQFIEEVCQFAWNKINQ